ncbi:MAG: hypothetical protein Kow0075_03610 [Salibacteraceae bacterium]
MKDAGLILRSTPYTDRSVILKILSKHNGCITAFYRFSSKKSFRPGVGQFIHFQAGQRPSGMPTITEASPLSEISIKPLAHQNLYTWLFCIELLERILPEGLIIHGLFDVVFKYYCLLQSNSMTNSPIIPAILLSTRFGLTDPRIIKLNDNSPSRQALLHLGVETGVEHSLQLNEADLFQTLLHELMTHYDIRNINSLTLVDM